MRKQSLAVSLAGALAGALAAPVGTVGAAEQDPQRSRRWERMRWRRARSCSPDHRNDDRPASSISRTGSARPQQKQLLSLFPSYEEPAAGTDNTGKPRKQRVTSLGHKASCRDGTGAMCQNQTGLITNRDMTAWSVAEQKAYIRKYCNDHPLEDYLDAVLYRFQN
jgi:hypothetical protein